MIWRPVLAILLPFLALALPWQLWPWLTPYVWFLFFPAAFFSVRLGSLINARRRTQAELQRYEQIVAISGDMLAFLDQERRFLVTNPQYAELVGAVPADLQQRHVADVLGAANYAYIKPYLDRALAGDIQRFIVEPIFQNGKRRVLDAEYRPVLQAGQVRGVVVSLRDITRLKASEEALKAAQRLAGIGSWSWDIQTNEHQWSDQVYCIYGRDPDLPPAIYPEVQQYFTSESWARLASAVENCLANGQPYEYDAEVVNPDGLNRWIIARGEATCDAAGNIINLHGTVQDITDRKHTEAEILRLNLNLEQRVIERTAELTAANHELDAFAYAVSHDLRTPLRAMSGFSQALVEDYGTQMPNEAHVYLDQIGIASLKMNNLIDGLLALSRSTRGTLQYSVLNISELSEHLLEELAQSDPGRQVYVQVQAGLQASGDVRMIASVLRNLLGNAWKYSANVAAPSIRVYAEELHGNRYFCIADNGAGFDKVHAGKLFQPFQRLHRQDEFPGIGIGLATVQRILHRHNGVIEARGEPGKGATFCFTLPNMTLNSSAGEKVIS